MKKARLFIAALACVCTLTILFLLGFGFANAGERIRLDSYQLQFHPVSPTTPTPTPFARGYFRLPFDRTKLSVISNGPGEGDHKRYVGTQFVGSGEAIDFSPRGWTGVYAARSGTVVYKQPSGLWGNIVVIYDATSGFSQYYAHLQSFGNINVGDQVSQGTTQIGVVGDTGCAPSCGTHLHFEVRDQFNPMSGPYSGDSENHSVRRMLGIGWFPWYPNESWFSGFTVRALPPHAPSQCSNVGTITLNVPGHSAITYHSHTEKYSGDITLNQKGFNPPQSVNIGHRPTPRYSETFDVEINEEKYWVHIRPFDETSQGWSSDDRVAHMGPFPLGINCPSSLPPNYDDKISQPEMEE